MSVINFTLSTQNFTERAKIIQEIQDQCTRAEKGENVDLKPTVQKLAGLVQRLNEEGKEIHSGIKITPEIRKEYEIHRRDVTGLNARVKALSAKTNIAPLRVKPIVCTALVAIGGIALLAFIVHRTGILSSPPAPTPPPPSPPTPPTYKIDLDSKGICNPYTTTFTTSLGQANCVNQLKPTTSPTVQPPTPPRSSTTPSTSTTATTSSAPPAPSSPPTSTTSSAPPATGSSIPQLPPHEDYLLQDPTQTPPPSSPQLPASSLPPVQTSTASSEMPSTSTSVTPPPYSSSSKSTIEFLNGSNEVRFTWPDQNSYKGIYVNGIFGEGIYKASNGDSYQGNLLNGIPNGQGQYTWANGDRYKGDFLNGVPHGNGRFSSSDQSSWHGSCANGKFLNWPDVPIENIVPQLKGFFSQIPAPCFSASKSSIDILNGIICCEGDLSCNGSDEATFTGPDQPFYKGNVVNGILGEGIYKASNGDSYKGHLVNGIPNGDGEYTWADGSRYNGSFVNGVPHGRGQIFTGGGGMYWGSYENGKSIYWLSDPHLGDKIVPELKGPPLSISSERIRDLFVKLMTSKF